MKNLWTHTTSAYDVLEVIPRASQEVIHASYVTLMKKHHPDIVGDRGKNQAFLINEAYALLKDPVKKHDYDARVAPPGKIIGNYRLLSQIAEGGFGKTYKAEHLITGMPVCIKHCSEISPLHEEVLISETKNMWDLRHYALPTARELLRLEDGSLALIQSFIEGYTIEQIVDKTKKRIPAEHVAWITERILNALHYIHLHGIVHGDIKPQNIIVQDKKHLAVLIDFGLSLSKPSKSSRSKGYTEVFAPPEQINASNPLIPQSDFYSLGMTMIYALSGSISHTEKKELPSSTPAPLQEFIRRITSKEIFSRPDWEKEDILETFRAVRKNSFGSSTSGMKLIEGLLTTHPSTHSNQIGARHV